MGHDLHLAASFAASQQSITLNDLTRRALSEYLEQHALGERKGRPAMAGGCGRAAENLRRIDAALMCLGRGKVPADDERI